MSIAPPAIILPSCLETAGKCNIDNTFITCGIALAERDLNYISGPSGSLRGSREALGVQSPRSDASWQLLLSAAAERSQAPPEAIAGLEYYEPNPIERAKLRRVSEKLPTSAWLIVLVEFCERFSYYGCLGVFQNYAQRPYKGHEGPGGLGLGQRTATSLGLLFQSWSFVTPIAGAIIADQYLGKFWTIFGSCMIYATGLATLFITSLPFSLAAGYGLAGFLTAIIFIGIGAGGIKANIGPLLAEQYTRERLAVKQLPSGERVILDPALTIQKIYMIYYLAINVGSLAALATTYLEKGIPWEFAAAYFLCLCMFLLGFAILCAGRKFYLVREAKTGVVTNAVYALWIMIKHRNADAAKPSWKRRRGGFTEYPWDDRFIDELKRTLRAFKVFAFFPIFWLAFCQIATNLVSQAGQMKSYGVPNDIMQTLDPATVIIGGFILQYLVYPALHGAGVRFRPITRMALGFVVVSLAMAYAAVLQYWIYSTGPCYENPLCPASEVNGIARGNDISIVYQTPIYCLTGLAELLASVTGSEYAYTMAPPSLRSLLQAIWLFTYAIGGAIVEALGPAVEDPTTVYVYIGIAGVTFCTALIFWACFQDFNRLEWIEEMDLNDQNEFELR
ncbi:hypothetical protein TWF696_007523 [Orbilia brochopaga]|uniref:Uncharacterized protein n=1 Tax=Orbilia brochopaga TaxID=3140254 RepID=A0AAV9ULK4_9PEZI